jgi:hypothetical protein
MPRPIPTPDPRPIPTPDPRPIPTPDPRPAPNLDNARLLGDVDGSPDGQKEGIERGAIEGQTSGMYFGYDRGYDDCRPGAEPNDSELPGGIIEDEDLVPDYRHLNFRRSFNYASERDYYEDSYYSSYLNNYLDFFENNFYQSYGDTFELAYEFGCIESENGLPKRMPEKASWYRPKVGNSAGLDLLDDEGKSYIIPRINVDAGENVTINLQFMYKLQRRSSLSFLIRPLEVSDESIRSDRQFNRSHGYSDWAPGVEASPLNFRFFVPIQLRGSSQWISFELLEEGQVSEILKVKVIVN